MPSPSRASVATELFTPSLRALERSGEAVAQRARETGLELLAAAGYPLKTFGDLDVRVPHELSLALLDNAVRVTGEPAFALRAGLGVERGDFGLYDLLVGSAPTLGASMQLAERYLPLLHDGARICLVFDGTYARWEHSLAPGLFNSAAANEYVVAGFLVGAQRALGFVAAPTEVCFMHPEPAYSAAYAAGFGAPVRFGCERNAIVLPKAALDLPLAHADPPLHAVLCRYGDELLKRLPGAHPFVERVRTLVRKKIASGALLSELAELLHMSESSVQRRLQAAGTTHTELVDLVRRELAVELLADSELNVSEIAFRLGFSHRPAFHRAFRRWFGHAPSEHRAHHARSAFYRFYEESR